MVAYDWGRNDYPEINAFLAFRALSIIEQRKRGRSGEVVKNHTAVALKAFCNAVKANEFDDGQIPIAYRLLEDKYSNSFEIPRYEFVLSELNKSEFHNEWFLKMVQAKNELKLAWDARGSGWAKDVSEEGWRTFAKHSDRARKLLVDVWEMDHNRPEAASEMISVAMADRSNNAETPRRWFDRAVAAQMDYPQAYNDMIFALLPRWGGSHRQMLEFAGECLDTERYDTDVPLFFLYTLRKIAIELDHNRWRKPFRDEKARADLERMFGGLSFYTSNNLSWPFFA